MVFVVPAATRIIECTEQFLPLNFTFDDFGDERAALSLSDKVINVGQESIR
jgi:hypothetical protein